MLDGSVALYPNGIALRLNKSIALLNEALPLSPTRPQIYFELGQANVLLGNVDTAVAYFQQGVDQAPWVGDSQWLMLTVGILSQRQDIIDRQLGIIAGMKWKPNAEYYQKAIDVAARVKNYPLATDFYQALIKLQPRSAAHYAGLAALYAKVGENQLAREATETAVKLDPSFATEAETFLNLLDTGELLDQ